MSNTRNSDFTDILQISMNQSNIDGTNIQPTFTTSGSSTGTTSSNNNSVLNTPKISLDDSLVSTTDLIKNQPSASTVNFSTDLVLPDKQKTINPTAAPNLSKLTSEYLSIFVHLIILN